MISRFLELTILIFWLKIEIKQSKHSNLDIYKFRTITYGNAKTFVLRFHQFLVKTKILLKSLKNIFKNKIISYIVW